MTTRFDRTLARLLLEACRFTYAVGAGTEKNRRDREESHKYLLSNSETTAVGKLIDFVLLAGEHEGATSKACVFVFADRNVVSYMGTEAEFDVLHNLPQARRSIQDWVQDAKAKPVPFQLDASDLGAARAVLLKGKVHLGFLQELKHVQGKVVRHLASNGGVGKKIIVTGHSQGAAEAALAIPALAAAGYSVESVYMFAPPRAGDDEFVKAADGLCSAIHRIEFGDDMVPHLPPIAVKSALESALSGHIAVRTAVSVALSHVTDFGYKPLGKLTYGHPEERTVYFDMTPEKEAELFVKRLKWIAKSPKNWGDHHHLAGREEEVDAGDRGNYTLLVSPEQYGWSIA